MNSIDKRRLGSNNGGPKAKRRKIATKDSNKIKLPIESTIEMGGPIKRSLNQLEKTSHLMRLYKIMSDSQKDRYELARRAAFNKVHVKSIIEKITKTELDKKNIDVVLTLQGITKIFVQDLIEGARQNMDEKGVVGQIHPTHILASFQTLKGNGKIPFISKIHNKTWRKQRRRG